MIRGPLWNVGPACDYRELNMWAVVSLAFAHMGLSSNRSLTFGLHAIGIRACSKQSPTKCVQASRKESKNMIGLVFVQAYLKWGYKHEYVELPNIATMGS